MNNRFIIVVPFYNVEKWIKYNIASVKKQNYDNFTCVLIDDISTDNTYEVANKIISNDKRFILVKNTEKKLALRNIYEGIQIAEPNEEDIIITLDGDDWLSNSKVLSYLNDFYNIQKCWLTYGSYSEFPSGKKGKFAKQIPQHVIDTKSFRQYEWCTSHLRTFKYHLWSKIKKQDLLDSEGNFYKMTWDLSFMFPMLEMAGSKSRYIQDILYVYNLDNPLNDHKVDNNYQVRLEQEIRSKNKYESLVDDGIRPEHLLRYNRFDIAAKLIFIKDKIRQINCNFSKDIYRKHLNVWNNFFENEPRKEKYEDFANSFVDLYHSIKQRGFDKNNKIPVYERFAINGAHRIASSILLGTNLYTEPSDISKGQLDCSYKYFMNKKDFVASGLDRVYLDEMALEFCRVKKNLYTLSLFPSHNQSIEKISNLIHQNFEVIYSKTIKLNKKGQLNYIHNLYHGEAWVGNKQNGYPGAVEKSNKCFINGDEVTVLLLESDNEKNLLSLKENVRSVCNVGKHSIHINDTQEETWRIASSVFNENSIHFLNNSSFGKTEKFDSYLIQYKNILKNRKDKHDFCVDASAVLSAYGLRDCRDLDFLHLHNIGNLTNDISCHNMESHHYDVNKNDIICDPKMHFYCYGIKMASIEIIKNMKISRDEQKDRVDVKLIGGLL
tara:strand:+ start:11875 stop:13866 length:1992 start_codon:yes stop_codon:yes gene_type:complete